MPKIRVYEHYTVKRSWSRPAKKIFLNLDRSTRCSSTAMDELSYVCYETLKGAQQGLVEVARFGRLAKPENNESIIRNSRGSRKEGNTHPLESFATCFLNSKEKMPLCRRFHELERAP